MLAKHFLLFTLFIGLQSAFFAQDLPNLISNNEVTTLAYWSVGDKAKYHCIQEEYQIVNDKEKTSTRTKREYDVNLTVSGQTDTSYQMKMTYSNYKNEKASPLEREMKKIFGKLTIHYAIDEMGVFKTILNKEELLQDMTKFLELTFKEMEKANPEVNLQILNTLKMTLLNIENIDALFSDDIMNIHGLYGQQLKLNQPEEYPTNYFLVNDVSLNGTAVVTLHAINKAQDACRVTEVQQPVQSELVSALGALLAAFGIPLEQAEAMKNVSCDSKTMINYEMKLSSGWITKIKLTSTVQIHLDGATTKTISKSAYTLE